MNGSMQRLGRTLVGSAQGGSFRSRGRTIVGTPGRGASSPSLKSMRCGSFWTNATTMRSLSSSSKDASNTSGADDETNMDGDEEEWIPPSRPLVGDQGPSREYAHVREQQQRLDPHDDANLHTKKSSTTMHTQEEEEEDEWIPPEQPALAGDPGDEHDADDEQDIYRKRLEQELQKLGHGTATVQDITAEMVDIDDPAPSDTTTTTPASSSSTDPFDAVIPDWLKTRRRRLEGTDLVQPHDAARAKQQKLLSDIPAPKHTLLTGHEIVTILEALGGQDVKCVMDNWNQPRMGGALGIFICTGHNHAQIRTLAEHLLRQLRRRDLQYVGVVGAAEGIEGNVGDPYEDWLVLDCDNYVVHFQTPSARQALNLEGLWSGMDGTHKLDLNDEDAVDDFIAANPVPVWYNSGASPLAIDWDKKVKELKKSKFLKQASAKGKGGFRGRRGLRRR